MGYLRHARSVPPPAVQEDTCVTAFARELDYIFATLRRLGGRPSELEDLAQEVFIVLHRNWSEIDTTRPLRPYLFGVAFRVFSADRRRRRREIPFEWVEPADESPDPETAFRRKELSALMLAALEQVPLRRRAVLVMHELDGVPILDVAQRLSMSKFGTYARLRKGRSELRAALRRLAKSESST